MAIPAIPSNFLVQQGNGQVWLSWNIVAGATSYTIQRSTDGVSFSTLATVAVNNYLDTSVTVGINYYYQVASVNGSGTSSYTSAQSVVPAVSGSLSLGQVRLMAQQRAEMVNSPFVTVPEWNTYINQSYFELYDLLVTAYEDYFMADPITFTTDGSNAAYDLPNGVNYNGARPFYKDLGVDLSLNTNNNAWVTLKRYQFIQRNRYVYPNITSNLLGVFNMQYRIMDSKIRFIPTPAAGQVIRVWYVPRMKQLLQDTDMLEGISGWSEYVVVDAAIKALTKEESDTTPLMNHKMMLKDRIEASAANRDIGEPDCISQTRRWADMNGVYGGPGYDGSYGGF